MDPKDLKQAVHSLHRYFLWANRMRVHFYDLVPKVANDPERDRFSSEAIEADLYMSFWYGELYVVIEGWKKLGLSEPEVDALLASPNVELLRRYRNGVFHFQKEYFDERFLGFMRDGQNAAAWVSALNRAFGAYFLNSCPRKISELSTNGVTRVHSSLERHNRAAFSCGVEALDSYLHCLAATLKSSQNLPHGQAVKDTYVWSLYPTLPPLS